MKRGLIAGGVGLIAVALGAAAPADARTIGKGRMTLSVGIERTNELVVFITQGAIKVKSKKQRTCQRSRSVIYKATDPNGQPIVLQAIQLSKGNGTYRHRNTFVYDFGGPLEPEEVPSNGGTYTFQARVPKQKDLKSRDRCVGLAAPVVSVVVPPRTG